MRRTPAILSPFPQSLVAAAGVCLALFTGGYGAILPMLAALAVGIGLTLNIQSQGLFKGPNFTFLSTFMLLAAANPTAAIEPMLACAVSLLTLLHCYQKPQYTHTIFNIFLIPGVGILFSPQWLLWAALLLVLVGFAYALSFRSFLAAITGVVTPAIAAIPLLALHWPESEQWISDCIARFNHFPLLLPTHLPLVYILSAAMALLPALACFLTAYGYPAKQRVRNMVLFAFTIGVLLLPLFTPAGYHFWLPMLNIAAAYHLAHLAATKRAGTFWLIISHLATIVFIFL